MLVIVPEYYDIANSFVVLIVVLVLYLNVFSMSNEMNVEKKCCSLCILNVITAYSIINSKI